MTRAALWFGVAYLAGALTATVAIARHGTELAIPLYAVASWLANASQGATFEVAVQPLLTLTTEPAPRAPKGNRR